MGKARAVASRGHGHRWPAEAGPWKGAGRKGAPSGPAADSWASAVRLQRLGELWGDHGDLRLQCHPPQPRGPHGQRPGQLSSPLSELSTSRNCPQVHQTPPSQKSLVTPASLSCLPPPRVTSPRTSPARTVSRSRTPWDPSPTARGRLSQGWRECAPGARCQQPHLHYNPSFQRAWAPGTSPAAPGASLLTCVQVHPVALARKGVSPVSSSPHQAWPVTVAHSPCSPRPLLPPPALEASFPHCLGTRKRPWQLGAQAGRDCPAAAGRVSTGPPHQAPHLLPHPGAPGLSAVSIERGGGCWEPQFLARPPHSTSLSPGHPEGELPHGACRPGVLAPARVPHLPEAGPVGRSPAGPAPAGRRWEGCALQGRALALPLGVMGRAWVPPLPWTDSRAARGPRSGPRVPGCTQRRLAGPGPAQEQADGGVRASPDRAGLRLGRGAPGPSLTRRLVPRAAC